MCRLGVPPLPLGLQSGALKALRELLHAGERLGVDEEATESLRACIRRREWEESARRALGGKASMSSLAGVQQRAVLLCTALHCAICFVRVLCDLLY
jgi:hypothetical protein